MARGGRGRREGVPGGPVGARGGGRGRTGGPGHGLGLAIVTAVATAHGGALELSANPDGGLTAVLEIPGGEVEPDPRTPVTND